MRFSVTTAAASSSNSLQPDASERVRSLLTDFRLLEAAGACELVADSLQGANAGEPARWWSALAACARGYRVAIFTAVHDGHPAISRWAETLACSSFAEESARLSLEYRYWLDDVPGGRAYVAWLSRYMATAELDGRSAERLSAAALRSRRSSSTSR